MIKVENLVKSYGKKTVVDDVSFHIKKGEVVGFLGPNGAGKTTTMNIITGYISSDSGKAAIDGFDILETPHEVKRRVGYLPEQPPLYYEMTVKEYLNFVYDLKQASKNTDIPRDEHIEDILKAIHIDHVKGRLIKNLSKGYKQRVGIAQALIGNPEVLILDEPTVGLDPRQIIEIRNLIGELKSKHTIILSSHVLPEVSAICQRVIIINEGRIVAEDTPAELSKKFIGNKYSAVLSGDFNTIISVLSGADYITDFCSVGNASDALQFEITFNGDTFEARKRFFNDVFEKGCYVIELKPLELSLEEIFIKLTANSKKEV